MTKRIANETMFWFHFLLIPLWIAFSVWAAPVIVLAATACHQLHLKLFRGCALSHLQRRFGGLQKEYSFLEFAYARILHHTPTRMHKRAIDGFLWVFPLAVSLLRITF